MVALVLLFIYQHRSSNSTYFWACTTRKLDVEVVVVTTLSNCQHNYLNYIYLGGGGGVPFLQPDNLT